MLVDYELFLPRESVESPSHKEKRLYSLEEFRINLIDRNGLPVSSVRERLNLEKDRDFRSSIFYVNGEDIRFEND
jgi:hypothetical protein